jgi:FkbM family methyltransferase
MPAGSARYAGLAAAPAAYLSRRWRKSRLLKKGVYRLGNALGDRVLLGTTLGGSKMALSMQDSHHRRIYFYGEYEPATTALFRRLVIPGSTVFDVGANAGYFSLLSCELGAVVRSFEPNPYVRALLERSASLQSGDIEIVAAACSDHEGTLPLYLSNPTNTGASSLTRPTANHVEVDLIALDDYVRRTDARPDLIKIDVEGHEYEVLVGARRLLETLRPTVIAEVGESKRDEVIELMESYRYAPHRILPDGSTVAAGPKLATGPENICFLPTA